MKKLFLFGAAALALSAHANTITFTDSPFNLANYSTVIYKSNPSATISFAQCLFCGTPGQALQVTTNALGNGNVIVAGLINNIFLYNPLTQGAISSIDASVSKNVSTSLRPGTASLGNNFRPMILQDGIYYFATILGASFSGGSTGYNTLSQSGLTANDFVQFDFATGTLGTGHPNFAGDPLLFGFAHRTSITGLPRRMVSIQADYDNLSLTIHSVPDSSSTLLLLSGSIAILLLAKRKVRVNQSGRI